MPIAGDDLVRDWVEQRTDVACRWAEAQKAADAVAWAPLDPSQPPKPADTQATVWGAGDAVRRLCEGYADVLRRRREAWKQVSRVGITPATIQSSLSDVIALWPADVSFTQQTVELSTEVQGDPQDVLLRLKEALSDAQARLTHLLCKTEAF